MIAAKELEREAIRHNQLGRSWATFWAAHGDSVARLEPYNLQRFRRLCNRLLALVVSGDVDGQHPVGACLPRWETDDANVTESLAQGV